MCRKVCKKIVYVVPGQKEMKAQNITQIGHARKSNCHMRCDSSEATEPNDREHASVPSWTVRSGLLKPDQPRPGWGLA